MRNGTVNLSIDRDGRPAYGERLAIDHKSIWAGSFRQRDGLSVRGCKNCLSDGSAIGSGDTERHSRRFSNSRRSSGLDGR